MQAKEEEVKINVGWYAFWAAILGSLMLLSAWIFWDGLREKGTDSTSSFFKLIAGMAGLITATKAASDVIRSIRGIKKPKWEYVKLLKCLKCNYKAEREFKQGEYVGMSWKEPCRVCGGPMVIDAIYAKPSEERRSII